jgi:hypothetical protein
MSDQALSRFRQLCGVTLLADEDGKNPVLCASVMAGGREYKRCVALAPLMEMLADGIRNYHDRLHSEMIGAGLGFNIDEDDIAYDEISGSRRSHRRGSPWYLKGKSHKTARQAPPRKTPFRRELPSQAAPEEPSYEEPSYEEPSDDEGYYDEEGDVLPPGVDPLQVQGWSDSIRRTARHLAESKAVKSLFTDLKNAAKSRKLQEIAVSAAAGPAAGLALNAAYKAHDALVAAKTGNPQAIAKLKALAKAASDGNQKAMQTLETAAIINDKLKSKEASTQVSGWLYNRPYRSNLDVVTAPLRHEFPSLGLAIREGWHDGLEFAKTMKRKPLFSLGV